MSKVIKLVRKHWIMVCGVLIAPLGVVMVLWAMSQDPELPPMKVELPPMKVELPPMNLKIGSEEDPKTPPVKLGISVQKEAEEAIIGTGAVAASKPATIKPPGSMLPKKRSASEDRKAKVIKWIITLLVFALIAAAVIEWLRKPEKEDDYGASW